MQEEATSTYIHGPRTLTIWLMRAGKFWIVFEGRGIVDSGLSCLVDQFEMVPAAS